MPFSENIHELDKSKGPGHWRMKATPKSKTQRRNKNLDAHRKGVRTHAA